MTDTKSKFENEDGIDLLMAGLNKLGLIPNTGEGTIELIFHNGFLLDTVNGSRTRINAKIEDYIN